MSETLETQKTEDHVFEADVSRLLHMMVHSVYSDKDIFLRELISNAADACEKFRYEAVSSAGLSAEGAPAQITVILDAEHNTLTVEDNGIGMRRDELIDALGTIARSGTRQFMERLDAANAGDKAELIGQFGVGFYASFMVADRVDVVSRRAGTDVAFQWSSDGKGSYTIASADLAAAPLRGTRVTLHLLEEARSYTEKWTIERIIREQSGHVPVPIALIDTPGAEPSNVTDGAALWTKVKSDISPSEYTDFYHSVSGQYDEPLANIHFRAEGRHEFTTLAFIPGSQPFDLFDPERAGRLKLYVKRVFITDEAELLPRYLRFVRGIVDTSDLPLNISREMIQQSPVLAAIRKGVTGRVLSTLEGLRDTASDTYAKIWSLFGPILKEGLYDDGERRDQLLKLSRFTTTTSGDSPRALADYVKDMKAGQEAIYYLTGTDLAQLNASPHLEGFRAKGIEVLLLSDVVDSFWSSTVHSFEEKPFKSITQGAADLDRIEGDEPSDTATADVPSDITDFIAFARETLKDQVADVRASTRLTESAVCLVASAAGPDRQLEKILQSAGRLQATAKPILEINAKSARIRQIATAADTQQREDAAWLLLDEARILEGDKPSHPRLFAERLSRLFAKAHAE